MPPLLWKYPKCCPACNAFYLKIWRNCTICGKKLANSWIWWFGKKVKACAVLLSIAILFCLMTYCTQQKEMRFYAKSYSHFKQGNFRGAWSEFEKAFWYNPAAKFSRASWALISQSAEAVYQKCTAKDTPAQSPKPAASGARRQRKQVSNIHSPVPAQRTIMNPARPNPVPNNLRNFKANPPPKENRRSSTSDFFSLFMWILVLGSSFLVYWDARRLCPAPTDKLAGMRPVGWLICCLTLWIVAFPYYLFQRKKLTEEPVISTSKLALCGVPSSFLVSTASPSAEARYSDVLCRNCGARSSKYAPGCERCGDSLANDSQTVMPAAATESAKQTQNPPPAPQTLPETKKCLYCSEDIQYAAVKCKHCGSRIGSNASAPQHWIALPADWSKHILTGIAVLGIAATLWGVWSYFENPIAQVQRAVFEGTTEPIEQLIREHPQVRSQEWLEDDTTGQNRVICKIVYAYTVDEQEYLGGLRILFTVGKKTAMINEIVFTGIDNPGTRAGMAPVNLPVNTATFLGCLENKSDMTALGMSGIMSALPFLSMFDS
jgi:ribosomal protein L40E